MDQCGALAVSYEKDVALSAETPSAAASCMKRVYRDKKASAQWSAAPGTKGGGRPADKLRVNCLFYSSCGLNGISFVRACGGSFRTVVFDALGGKRVGCVLGQPTRRRPVLPGPAPPRRPALRRPAHSARAMRGFWIP